ncbi:MAG: tetratricopeptide repeat protein [Acidobacteriota bacterium]
MGDGRGEESPWTLSPRQFLAYTLNNHAVEPRRTGDVRQAARVYRRALRLDRRCQPCLYSYANLLAARGRPAGARRLYDRALRLDPWDNDARRNREALPPRATSRSPW